MVCLKNPIAQTHTRMTGSYYLFTGCIRCDYFRLLDNNPHKKKIIYTLYGVWTLLNEKDDSVAEIVMVWVLRKPKQQQVAERSLSNILVSRPVQIELLWFTELTQLCTVNTIELSNKNKAHTKKKKKWYAGQLLNLCM